MSRGLVAGPEGVIPWGQMRDREHPPSPREAVPGVLTVPWKAGEDGEREKDEFPRS